MQLVDPAGDLGLAQLLAAGTEGDVVPHGHVREQRVVLEDRVDVALVGRRAGDVDALEAQGPGRRGLEAGDHAQGRGLAAARGAEEREELARGDREAGVVDRHELAEALGDVVDLDDRRGRVRARGARRRPRFWPWSARRRRSVRRLWSRRSAHVLPDASAAAVSGTCHIVRRAHSRMRPPLRNRSARLFICLQRNPLPSAAPLGMLCATQTAVPGRDGGDSDGTRELHRRGLEARRERAPPTRCSTRPRARSSPRSRRATPPTSTRRWPPRPRRSPPGATPLHVSAARSCWRWPTPSRTTSTSSRRSSSATSASPCRSSTSSST